MHNIFTTLPVDVTAAMHQTCGSKKIQQSFRAIESFIFRYVPLSHSVVETSSLLSFSALNKVFKSLLKERIHVSSDATDDYALQIADLVLDLCEEYLAMPESSTFFPYNQRYTPSASMNAVCQKSIEWMTNLQRNLLNRKDLKRFLVLSYYYIETHEVTDADAVKKKDWQEWVDLIFNDTNAKQSSVEDMLKNFKNKHPLILSAFLMPLDKVALETRRMSQPEDRTRNPIHARSILDLPVLTSMIRTTRQSNNPCVINETDTRERLNLDTFLKNTSFAIHSSFVEKNNTIQDFFHSQKGYSNYTPAVAYIFDQFLLERLTGINFINSLYQQSMKIPDSITKIFARFISSPLCSSRMKMLDYQTELLGNSEFNEFISHEWYEELWGRYLEMLLEYHLNCTLPVLDLMYHYMMGLAFEKSLILSKEHYMKSMDDYFLSVCKSSDENDDGTASKEDNHNNDELLFFRENNNKIIIPNRCSFPLKDMNPNIKETGKGGVAGTITGQRIKDTLTH